MQSRRPARDRVPRFFLAEIPVAPGSVRLAAGEAEHAERVLRLVPGDRCEGLDGEGGRWPLVVAAGPRGRLAMRVAGPAALAPRAGEEGSPLPWIEVAVAWPRKARAEEMIGRLVQLGASALTPLAARHTGAEPLPEEAPERWLKLAQSACKQCGRAWLPRFHPPATPHELAGAHEGAPLALLDPDHGMPFDTWLRSLTPHPKGMGTAARPIVLAIGPEGGFDEDERAAFHERGATSVRIAPYVLRVETAAEAALAVATAILMRADEPVSG